MYWDSCLKRIGLDRRGNNDTKLQFAAFTVIKFLVGDYRDPSDILYTTFPQELYVPVKSSVSCNTIAYSEDTMHCASLHPLPSHSPQAT